MKPAAPTEKHNGKFNDRLSRTYPALTYSTYERYRRYNDNEVIELPDHKGAIYLVGIGVNNGWNRFDVQS